MQTPLSPYVRFGQAFRRFESRDAPLRRAAAPAPRVIPGGAGVAPPSHRDDGAPRPGSPAAPLIAVLAAGVLDALVAASMTMGLQPPTLF